MKQPRLKLPRGNITAVNHGVFGIARAWRCDKHIYLRAYVYLFYKQQSKMNCM